MYAKLPFDDVNPLYSQWIEKTEYPSLNEGSEKMIGKKKRVGGYARVGDESLFISGKLLTFFLCRPLDPLRMAGSPLLCRLNSDPTSVQV